MEKQQQQQIKIEAFQQSIGSCAISQSIFRYP